MKIISAAIEANNHGETLLPTTQPFEQNIGRKMTIYWSNP